MHTDVYGDLERFSLFRSIRRIKICEKYSTTVKPAYTVGLIINAEKFMDVPTITH